MRYALQTFCFASLFAVLSGCGPLIVTGSATAARLIHDRRTAATQIEDQAIEFKAYSAFRQAGETLGRSHINANSYNNVVLLTGEVDRPQLRQWAEDTVRGIDKVRFVHNELTVAPPSHWGSRSNDAWLTLKAKSSLLKIQDLPDFDPTRVKVITERGIVYLFGLVTPQEGDAVTGTVRHLEGVQQVVKLFEYIGAT
jgi:osmotically-inducible protein OsmY